MNIGLREDACIASVVIDNIQSSSFALATDQSICDLFGKATPFLPAALRLIKKRCLEFFQEIVNLLAVIMLW